MKPLVFGDGRCTMWLALASVVQYSSCERGRKETHLTCVYGLSHNLITSFESFNTLSHICLGFMDACWCLLLLSFCFWLVVLTLQEYFLNELQVLEKEKQ